MKREKWLFILFAVVAFALNSCQLFVDDDDDGSSEAQTSTTEAPIAEATLAFSTDAKSLNIVPMNESITLSVKAEVSANTVSYQWYESLDGTTANASAIQGATGTSFEVPAATSRGIRYYYCTATTAETKINSSVAIVVCTGLPLLQIDTENSATPSPAKEKVNGRLQIFYPNGEKYDSGDKNEFTIKVRGNATAGYPKRPYKLKLPKKANLIDPNSSSNKDKNWVLLAGYCDKTLLRSKTGFYAASLFNEIAGNEQLYVPASEFVDVVLNGEYIGNYCLTDSVKEGSSRVSVNEKNTVEGGIGFVAEYDPSYYANEAKWFKSSVKSYPYTFKFPDTDDADFDSYMAQFENTINDFEAALYAENSEAWKNYIDIESFARWFLVHNILANIDTNYFLSKKDSSSTSKLVMGPVWDFEWSIGIGWYDGSRPRPADYWCVNGWYFEELLKKTEFIDALKSQWAALKSQFPNIAETINGKMDEWAQEIGVSQKANFTKWDILNTRVSVGGIPLGSYEAELKCDKQFMISRISWLDSAINAL